MRFILADPYLSDLSGHCFAYLESLRAELAKRGQNSLLLGSQTLSTELLRLGVRRGFTPETCITSAPRGLKDRLAGLFRKADGPFFRDLQALTSDLTIGPDDLLILNSLRPQHMAELARWLVDLPPARRPWVALIIHFTSSPDGKPKKRLRRAYETGFTLLREKGAADRILLLADTDALVEEIASLSQLRVQLAPIPHVSDGTTAAAPNDQVQISYMGQARPDKGFDLLPAVADQLAPDLKSGRLKFSVQSFAPAYLGDLYQNVVAKLRDSGCVLLDEILTEEAYKKLLEESDIILLPYSGETYRRQSSGVLAEAISAGKIVIAPLGTWIGQQIEITGAGLAYDATDPHGLTQALQNALNTYPTLSAKARSAAHDWCAFHNAGNLLAIIDQERLSRMGTTESES